MKKILGSVLSLVASTTIFANTASNPCLDNIQKHYDGRTAHFGHCNLQDGDMVALLNLLNKHPEIKELYLYDNNITSMGALALSLNKTLELLSLEGNHVGSTGARALARSNLIGLSLANNQLGEDGALELAKTRTIKYLSVENNHIPAQGIYALIKNTTLEGLFVGGNTINDTVLRSLSNNQTLHDLSLINCQIDDEGAQILANSYQYNKLSWLELGDNHIGLKGLKALSQVSRNFGYLGLSSNNVTDEGVALISQAAVLEIDLSGNQISDVGVQALVKNEYFEVVYLFNNHIGDAGAIALANAHLPELRFLNLGMNKIGDAGAVAFANHPNLIGLFLYGNNLHDEAAFALAKNPNLEMLDVGLNHISAAGIQALKDSLTLKYLNTYGNVDNVTRADSEQVHKAFMQKHGSKKFNSFFAKTK